MAAGHREGSALKAASGATGLADFDRTVWTPSRPRATLFVPSFLGAGLVRIEGRCDGVRAEVSAPGGRAVRLMIQQRASPSTEIRFDGEMRRIPEEAGAHVLLPQGVDSQWLTTPQKRIDTLSIHLDPTLIDDVAIEETGRLAPALAPRVSGCDPTVAALGRTLLEEASSEEGPSPLAWRSAATLLALHLVRGAGAGSGGVVSRGGLAPWALRKTVAQMRERLGEDVTLNDLAEAARLSPYHFCRAFAVSLGEPPHRHLQRLRIQAARRLLETTDLGVEEIARRVGYASQQSFGRVFRQWVGIPPAAYRRRAGPAEGRTRAERTAGRGAAPA